MGAGRRSIKLSNLSAANNPEIKEEQAPVMEATPIEESAPVEPSVEAPAEEPVAFEVSGAVMKEPEEAPIEEPAPAEEPAAFEVSGAVMKEPEEASIE
ncbi:MAG: hypothetical protein IK059_01070 [Firmicutes bacterium]|nr:hypothetical protein [Bacillota bacterium]